jgi:hypothetical protein
MRTLAPPGPTAAVGVQSLDLSVFPSLPMVAGPLLPGGGSTIPMGGAIPTYRAINDIVAQVTVDEDHDDELMITEHPVEYGAAITDHAFKRPAEVRVRVGWSEAGGLPNLFSQAVSDVKIVYQRLLDLQGSRNPFTLYTGKRTYRNMLVAAIRVHTDSTFEHSFLADITLREIILVSTQTITASGVNPNALGNPEKNTPVLEKGGALTVPTQVTATQVTSYGGNLASALPVGGTAGTGVAASFQAPPETFGGTGDLSPPQLPGPVAVLASYQR